MPEYVTGFAEMVLIVEDVPKAAEFYEKVVGLTVEKEADDEWAWFTIGKHRPLQRIGLHKGKLLYEDKSPYPEGSRWGHIHYALHVEPDNLEKAVRHVRDHGVEVYGPESFKWMNAKSYYFYDPDGNLIEFWAEQALTEDKS